MRFAVVCSVRNEGPFLVEWVAWYRHLGFTDIVVVTNDCTDHSPELLDAMAPAGVTHLRHDVPDGTNICARKLEAAKALPQVSGADWVLVCDVDEFLVIHRGAGRVTDLIPDDAGFLGMAINWRVFGTGGRIAWEDGLVHRQFLRTSESRDFPSTWIKTIHAQPGWFRRLGEHGPKRLLPRHAGRWGQDGMAWVNADGDALPEWTPDGDYMRRVPMARVSHATAQMNHYMIRSEESFGLKKGTLSSVAGKDRYTDSFFDRYNRNEVFDDSALRHAAAFDAAHAALMALPDVARLHHLCCADYVARLAAKAGRLAGDDPRHAHHLALAAQN
ncbi:glycosyltransferase family 2 protein [Pseudotabrizicola alkalilacus]|uniref:Glycosyltransferase family 2 protein n=1 Tax=Pseudotabrizicola alkalilacus TaxID=2305252 RepID=A0A411Z5T6_9RHOB|nr:glycosyltransferase family 2 protein [Pseudotabrizicola alkalilacus]RGP38382.1 glycosyltransferase family 2 protein [Pseudotabrizicola alkalilacus]